MSRETMSNHLPTIKNLLIIVKANRTAATFCCCSTNAASRLSVEGKEFTVKCPFSFTRKLMPSKALFWLWNNKVASYTQSS